MAKRKSNASNVSIEKVFVITILFILLISSFSISIIEKVPLWDAVFWTMCSLTSGSCFMWENFYKLQTVRTFTFINGIGFIIIISFLAAKIAERLSRVNMVERTMTKKIEELKDHFIVCGYGRVGEKISSIMTANGMPFVVIDKNPNTLCELKDVKGLCIEGDALDSRILEKAGIRKARGLIAVLDKDADNISLVLTANDINPDLLIGARADSEDAIRRLHRAGAEIVIIPEVVGGIELAKEVLKLGEIEGQKMVSKK